VIQVLELVLILTKITQQGTSIIDRAKQEKEKVNRRYAYAKVDEEDMGRINR